VRDPELQRWIDSLEIEVPDFRFPVSLRALNAILPPEDQASISQAAWLMHRGRAHEAELARAWAGYDYTARRADHIHRGLTDATGGGQT
jgi:hypothetical protein